MMVGYILTPTQKTAIQGKFYSENQFFNCVADINGDWYLFLSRQDMPEVIDTDYIWIFDLPRGEYTPPIPPPFPS